MSKGGIDMTQYHAPIEGVDYDTVTFLEYYDVPLEEVLSSSAKKLWQLLMKGKDKQLSLDTVLQTVAKIVKKTCAYDFNSFAARNVYKGKEHVENHDLWAETDLDFSLQGVCAEGSKLAVMLLNALCIENLTAQTVSTKIRPELLPEDIQRDWPDGIGHSVVMVSHPKIEKRLLNVLSGSIPFEVVTNHTQYDKIGIPSGIPFHELDAIEKSFEAYQDPMVNTHSQNPTVPIYYVDERHSSGGKSGMLLAVDPLNIFPECVHSSVKISKPLDLSKRERKKVELIKSLRVYREGIQILPRRFGSRDYVLQVRHQITKTLH